MSKLLKVIVNTLLLLAILSAGALVIPPFAGITTLVSDGMGNTNISRGAVTYAKKTDTSSVATGDKILVDDNSGKYIYTIQSLDIAAGTASVKNVISGDTTEITVRATVSKVIITIPVIGFLSMAAQSREGIMIIGLAILFLVILFILSEVWKRDEEEEDDEEEEEDEEDPRAELVRRLLEYKMYKYISYELKERRQDAAQVLYHKQDLPEEVKAYKQPVSTEELLAGVTLSRMHRIFVDIIRRQNNRIDPIRSTFGTLQKEEVDMDQMREKVAEYIEQHEVCNFRELLLGQATKMQVIIAFLIILEMMKEGVITIVQEESFGEIHIAKNKTDESGS